MTRRALLRHRTDRPALGAWVDAGACRGHDQALWYPPVDAGRHDRDDDPYEAGRAVCADCPVAVDCLAYAIAAGETLGMWGAHDPDERRRLTRQLRITKPELFSEIAAPRIGTIQVKGELL